MDDRIVEFIQALRASGVRVSLAESADSMRAIQQMGITDRALFKAALRTTLVKEHADFPIYEQLFPAFFNVGTPPMQQPGESGMSEEQQEQLDAATQELMQQLSEKLKELLQRLTEGKGLTREELEQMAQRAGMSQARSASPQMQRYLASQMARQMGLNQLQDLLLNSKRRSSSRAWTRKAANRPWRWRKATPIRYKNRSSSTSVRIWRSSSPSR